MGAMTNKQVAEKLASQTLGMGLSRQKYWSEIKVGEKIERLRTLLKSMVTENANLRRELSTIKRHTHDQDGKAVIVKPLSDEYGEMLAGNNSLKSASSNPDDVYI